MKSYELPATSVNQSINQSSKQATYYYYYNYWPITTTVGFCLTGNFSRVTGQNYNGEILGIVVVAGRTFYKSAGPPVIQLTVSIKAVLRGLLTSLTVHQVVTAHQVEILTSVTVYQVV